MKKGCDATFLVKVASDVDPYCLRRKSGSEFPLLNASGRPKIAVDLRFACKKLRRNLEARSTAQGTLPTELATSSNVISHASRANYSSPIVRITSDATSRRAKSTEDFRAGFARSTNVCVMIASQKPVPFWNSAPSTRAKASSIKIKPKAVHCRLCHSTMNRNDNGQTTAECTPASLA